MKVILRCRIKVFGFMVHGLKKKKRKGERKAMKSSVTVHKLYKIRVEVVNQRELKHRWVRQALEFSQGL